MGPTLVRQIAQTTDLSHRLRRLSFFEGHFRRHVGDLAARNGLTVAIEPVRLTRAFLAWSEDFTAQRAAAATDRRDYIVFTAGMLLRRLLEVEPLVVTRRGPPATAAAEPMQQVVDFWPDGFLYVEYCLSVLQAVLQQEFDEPPGQLRPAALQDVHVWWSFRENVAEDLATAIGFFDLFAGAEPEWQFPLFAAQRPAMRRAALAGPALR